MSAHNISQPKNVELSEYRIFLIFKFRILQFTMSEFKIKITLKADTSHFHYCMLSIRYLCSYGRFSLILLRPSQFKTTMYTKTVAEGSMYNISSLTIKLTA